MQVENAAEQYLMNRRGLTLLVAVLCVLPSVVTAKYGKALTDSLLKQLPQQTVDTSKCLLLCDLAGSYSAYDPKKGLEYAQQASAIAQKRNWKKGLAEAAISSGICYTTMSDTTQALKNLHLALNYYTGTTNLARKSKILQSIGIVYLNAGAVPVAEEFFQEAEQIATKSHDLPTQARAKLNLGNLYRFKELYTAALEYLLDGLALAQKANDSVSLPAFYGNIALIYDNERNLPLAMEYYNKARQIFESAGNKLNAGRCLYNIAVLYRTQGAYEKSYALYDTVWQIFSERLNKVRI